MLAFAEVFDEFGGSIKSVKNTATGNIMVNVHDGRTNLRYNMILDPDDPKTAHFLNKTYQPVHLAILLSK
jgi:hypothetical protein